MSAFGPTENRRILVVDDNASIHRDFVQILGRTTETSTDLAAAEAALFGETTLVERQHFDLDSAYQGQEALEMVTRARAEGRPYALAFVDMRMPPGWDGVETIEQLWRADSALQIVICSAYSDYSWEDMAKRLELRDRLLILKKPFDNIEIYQLATALAVKWQLTHDAMVRMAELEDVVEERTRNLRASNEALKAEAAERARLETQLALHRKLESIGQLAAGIAHEINTPIQYVGDSLYFLRSACAELCSLQSHYDRLLRAEPNSAAAAAAQSAATSARAAADVDLLHQEIPLACDRALGGIDRVAKIVRALKEFARPRDHEQRPADINEAIESTLLVAHGEYKDIAEVTTDLGELPLVTCNVGELNQAFLNLLVNAVDAIKAKSLDAAKGRIVIRTSSDDLYVTVSISDNGTGIAPAIADRIYDPFFTTKAFGQGTGQGLAFVYAIVVTNHAGTIVFETKPHEGTTFVVRLPISGAAGAHAAKLAAESV